MIRPSYRSLLAGACVTTLLGLAASARAQVELDVRVLTGESLPGGVLASSFFLAPPINASSQLAFVTGAGATESLYGPDASGSLARIAIRGDPAPGTALTFSDFDREVALGDGGHVVFEAALSSAPSGTRNGVWSSDPAAGVSLVVRGGDAAPGAPLGAIFDDLFLDHWIVNGQGLVGLEARLENGPGGVGSFEDDGIWTFSGGALALLALEGSAHPGDPGGPALFLPRMPALNDLGEPAFYDLGRLFGPDPTTGAITVRIRVGDPAPGTVGTVDEFPSFAQRPQVNDAREVTFFAETQPPAGARRDAVWGPDAAGGFGLAARQSLPADDPPGVAFADLNSSSFRTAHPQMNASGQVVFRGPLKLSSGGVTAETDSGIWRWTAAGGRLLVVREGDPTPGLGPHTALGPLDNPTLNDAGEIVFAADLVGTGVTAADDRAVFFATAGGALLPLLREGDLVNVGPGDDRTVETLTLIDGANVRTGRSSLNDAGEVSLLLDFTDGSQAVVVARLTPPPQVPLPAWLALALASALVAAAWRVWGLR